MIIVSTLQEGYNIFVRLICLGLNRLEMAPKLDSGMIFGVRIWPLRKSFHFSFSFFGIACSKDASIAIHLIFSGAII